MQQSYSKMEQRSQWDHPTAVTITGGVLKRNEGEETQRESGMEEIKDQIQGESHVLCCHFYHWWDESNTWRCSLQQILCCLTIKVWPNEDIHNSRTHNIWQNLKAIKVRIRGFCFFFLYLTNEAAVNANLNFSFDINGTSRTKWTVCKLFWSSSEKQICSQIQRNRRK